MAVTNAVLFEATINGNASFLETVPLPGRGIIDLRFCSGNTVLHTHVGMKKREARPDFLRHVLREDADELLSVMNDNGELVHHIAAKCGQVNAIEVLVECGEGPVYLTIPNQEGRNPIQLAFEHISSVDLVIRLVEAVIGAYPDRSSIPEFFNESTLLLAVETNSCDLVKLVYSITSCGSRKPFHAAIASGNTDMIKIILRQFPDLAKSTDDDKRTPHHLAAEDNKASTLKMFLEEHREAAYLQDNNGLTVAHTAALHNNVAGLKLLMKCAPDSFNLKDNQRRNAAHHAAISERGLDAFGYIFEQDILFCLLCDVDHQGNAPIHLLASRLHTVPAASLGLLSQSIIPELHNRNLKRTNSAGLTPGDIVRSSNYHPLTCAQQAMVKEFEKAAPPSKDRAHVTLPITPNNENKLEIMENERTKLKKKCYWSFTIVLTIAALSFSGILEPPGGFNQNDKDTYDRGTAMLSNTTAFKLFSFFNKAAWTCSVLVVALFIVIFSSNLSIRYLKYTYYMGLITTTISFITLMFAVVASTCATERKSGPLFIVNLTMISASICILIIICCFLLRKMIHMKKDLPQSLNDKDR